MSEDKLASSIGDLRDDGLSMDSEEAKRFASWAKGEGRPTTDIIMSGLAQNFVVSRSAGHSGRVSYVVDVAWTMGGPETLKVHIESMDNDRWKLSDKGFVAAKCLQADSVIGGLGNNICRATQISGFSDGTSHLAGYFDSDLSVNFECKSFPDGQEIFGFIGLVMMLIGGLIGESLG